jgi:hypothetical protein
MYRRLLKSYGLQQTFTHPHTPEQDGVAEAYHKTFKRECVWQPICLPLKKFSKPLGHGSRTTTIDVSIQAWATSRQLRGGNATRQE